MNSENKTKREILEDSDGWCMTLKLNGYNKETMCLLLETNPETQEQDFYWAFPDKPTNQRIKVDPEQLEKDLKNGAYKVLSMQKDILDKLPVDSIE